MADTEKRTIAPKDVDYNISVVQELPTSGNRGSTLELQLDRVKQMVLDDGNREATTKSWLKIAAYKGNGACGSAAQALRKRHGKPEVEGWHFASRKTEDNRYTLFARFDPSVVTEEAQHLFRKEQAERVAQAKASRKASASDGAKQADARVEAAKK